MFRFPDFNMEKECVVFLEDKIIILIFSRGGKKRYVVSKFRAIETWSKNKLPTISSGKLVIGGLRK